MLLSSVNKDNSVFSARGRLLQRSAASQTTGEMQANNLQHPGLVRMPDGGIKERGDGGERAAQPPQLLLKRLDGVIRILPLRMRITCHFLLKLRQLLDHLHILHL